MGVVNNGTLEDAVAHLESAQTLLEKSRHTDRGQLVALVARSYISQAAALVQILANQRREEQRIAHAAGAG